TPLLLLRFPSRICATPDDSGWLQSALAVGGGSLVHFKRDARLQKHLGFSSHVDRQFKPFGSRGLFAGHIEQGDDRRLPGIFEACELMPGIVHEHVIAASRVEVEMRHIRFPKTISNKPKPAGINPRHSSVRFVQGWTPRLRSRGN